MIRQLGAGAYTYMPLGLRVLHKVIQIVREEMDAAGAIELLMPALQPVELWKESGRYEAYGDLLMKLTISGDHHMALGPTHEEVITDLVRDLFRSYKQLPITLYQIQTKFRDEPRPRFGIVRTREFIMKDAYSIDADLAQLNQSYDAMYEAYCRIFDRCGLPYVIVEAESGPIGGDSSHEFMVPCATGEDKVLYCANCGYAANQERAEVGGHDRPTTQRLPRLPPYQTVPTPGKRTIQRSLRIPGGRGIDLGQAARLPGRRQAGRRARARRPRAQRGQVPPGRRGHGRRPGRRGDDREGHRGTHGLPRAGRDQDPAGDRPRDRRDADGRRRRQCGRTSTSRASSRAATSRSSAIHDIRNADAGDPCPRCGSALEIKAGLEIGHVFKLGTKYSKVDGGDLPRRERERDPRHHGLLRDRHQPDRRRAPSRPATTTTASSGRCRSRPITS